MNKLVDSLAKNVLIVKIHPKTKQTSSPFNNITYILTQHLALGADKFQGTISDISSEKTKRLFKRWKLSATSL